MRQLAFCVSVSLEQLVVHSESASRRECGGGLGVNGPRAPPPVAGIQIETLVANAAQLLHKLQEVMTKLYTNEGIDEGVQAAPQKGHTLGDVSGIEEPVVIAAVFGSSLYCDNCSPKKDQVVGHLGDQEDSDHSEDHLDCLIPFKVTSLAKGLNDAAVTDAHDQEWKDKSQNNLAGLDADAQFVLVA